MIKIKNIFIVCLLVASAALGKSMKPPQRIVDSEYVVGDPKAPVTIYEYGSLTCHVCASFYLEVLPKILKVMDGKIKVVLRPFTFNKLDIVGAQMILYSKDPHGLSKALYERQKDWLGAKDQVGAMVKIAKDHGMPEQDIKASFADRKLENAILSKRIIVKAESAPIFKVGNKTLQGLPQWDYFERVLEGFVEHVLSGKGSNSFDPFEYFKQMSKEDEGAEEQS